MNLCSLSRPALAIWSFDLNVRVLELLVKESQHQPLAASLCRIPPGRRYCKHIELDQTDLRFRQSSETPSSRPTLLRAPTSDRQLIHQQSRRDRSRCCISCCWREAIGWLPEVHLPRHRQRSQSIVAKYLLNSPASFDWQRTSRLACSRGFR